MASKILTKTDRMMEDQILAVQSDPVRADALAKARAFKRTWIELAEALSRVQSDSAWERWGFPDFDAYCRRELHLRGSTVAKLLGSFRFLETSAPRVLERARTEPAATIPSVATVDFVRKASERGAADEETLRTIHRAAFEEGDEAPLLAKKYREVAFPEDDEQRGERLRGQIATAARRLASLIAEEGAPVPRKLAVRVEETVGELLAAIDDN
ncbi:MAG: hypothetical protein KBG28_30850 [Kofleriaceae bacterium]|jgi:hypothetical protein|nr:hypothetical protein [Kofleriaceae bacterium]MBP9208408.1 hypothetical protein [Kofleriaceae bacterium]